MKKLLIITAGLLAAFAAMAYTCTTHMIIIDGRTILCTTCCDNRGNCRTTC
jgi:hypothetical protein